MFLVVKGLGVTAQNRELLDEGFFCKVLFDIHWFETRHTPGIRILFAYYECYIYSWFKPDGLFKDCAHLNKTTTIYCIHAFVLKLDNGVIHDPMGSEDGYKFNYDGHNYLSRRNRYHNWSHAIYTYLIRLTTSIVSIPCTRMQTDTAHALPHWWHSESVSTSKDVIAKLRDTRRAKIHGMPIVHISFLANKLCPPGYGDQKKKKRAVISVELLNIMSRASAPWWLGESRKKTEHKRQTAWQTAWIIWSWLKAQFPSIRQTET